jgi:hypothetical protein
VTEPEQPTFYGILPQPDDRRNINAYRPPPVAGKPVQIDLLYIWETGRYQVTRVTNTVWYNPGDMLTQEIVGEICKIHDWTISIQSYQLIKKVFDFIKPNLSLIP